MLQKTIPGRPSTSTVQLAPKTPISNIQMKPPQPQQPTNSNFVPNNGMGTPMHGHPNPTPPLQSGDGKILSKQKLQELSKVMDGSDRLEDEAIELLILIADEFVDSVTNFACKLAKHRKSQVLEVKDVLLHLEKNWNITVPGFLEGEILPPKKRPFSDSHRQRLLAVKKSKK